MNPAEIRSLNPRIERRVNDQYTVTPSASSLDVHVVQQDPELFCFLGGTQTNKKEDAGKTKEKCYPILKVTLVQICLKMTGDILSVVLILRYATWVLGGGHYVFAPPSIYQCYEL